MNMNFGNNSSLEDIKSRIDIMSKSKSIQDEEHFTIASNE